MKSSTPKPNSSDIPSSSPILFTIGSALSYLGWSQVSEEERAELEIWPIPFLTRFGRRLLNRPALRLSLKKDLQVIARHGMKKVALSEFDLEFDLEFGLPAQRLRQASNPTRQE
jgi:hypothetical protein